MSIVVCSNLELFFARLNRFINMADSTTSDPVEKKGNSVPTNQNLNEPFEMDITGRYIKYITRFQHNGVKRERNGYIVFRNIHTCI